MGALAVHGFTGNPSTMRGIAEALAAEGFAVELPRLPGHGTTIEDMLTTTWDDWSGAAEAAYEDLASRCSRVVVAGLSMGGAITAWLAVRQPEIAGIAVVNPSVEPVAESFIEILQGALDGGVAVAPGIASDIAKPGVTESAYAGSPVAAAITLMKAQIELAPRLGEIRCPVLLLNSRQDHVVPPSNGDYFAEQVSGPVERVFLENSYHVATLDYDKDEVERRVVDFALKVTAA